MDTMGEVLRNMQTGTAPILKKEGIKGFDLKVFEEACRARGVSLEETIVKFLALTDEQAVEAKSNPISLFRDQAKMSLDIAAKYEPDLSAVKHSGDIKEPVTFIISK